jgi:hypothetical protein
VYLIGWLQRYIQNFANERDVEGLPLPNLDKILQLASDASETKDKEVLQSANIF